jgi:UDP-glucose 4-epimerase
VSGHQLVLGGSGFIGRHVALQLAMAGHEVTIADRLPPPMEFPPEIAHNIRFMPVELGEVDWERLVDGAAIVHHYAWASIPASANANPIGDLTTNVLTTIALLDALRRRSDGAVMIFSSSGGSVYGKLAQVPVPENHLVAPITAYAAGKVTAEIYLGLFRALHGLDCRIARISNPFGCGQDLARGLGAATKFLHCALTDTPIEIWGDGEVIRDYIHIADVAAGLAALALAPRHPEHSVFNIGSGIGVSLNGIIEQIELRLGRTLQVRRTAARPFDVPVSVLDISRAQSVLGWSPKLSFAAGIERTFTDLAAGGELSTLD